MNLEKKLELYNLLLDIGFKEIEVGFPSASKVEFDFLRKLVDDDLIPDDVRIQVLVQAREHLIEKTFEALKGVKQATVHLYNSTSVAQRKIVFAKEKDEIIELALKGVDLIKKYEKEHDGDIMLEYSPESFTGTELEFAADQRPNGIQFLAENLLVHIQRALDDEFGLHFAHILHHMSFPAFPMPQIQIHDKRLLDAFAGRNDEVKIAFPLGSGFLVGFVGVDSILECGNPFSRWELIGHCHTSVR
jgi:hypothetical protein